MRAGGKVGGEGGRGRVEVKGMKFEEGIKGCGGVERDGIAIMPDVLAKVLCALPDFPHCEM